MSRMRSRLTRAVAAGALLAALAGCTAPTPWVKPYEREHFADPIMSMSRNPVSSLPPERFTFEVVNLSLD